MSWLILQMLLPIALAIVLGAALGWLLHRSASRVRLAELRAALGQRSRLLEQARADVSMLTDDYDELRERNRQQLDSLESENRRIPGLENNLEKSQLLVRQMIQRHDMELRELNAEKSRLAEQLAARRRRERASEAGVDAGATTEQAAADVEPELAPSQESATSPDEDPAAGAASGRATEVSPGSSPDLPEARSADGSPDTPADTPTDASHHVSPDASPDASSETSSDASPETSPETSPEPPPDPPRGSTPEMAGVEPRDGVLDKTRAAAADAPEREGRSAATRQSRETAAPRRQRIVSKIATSPVRSKAEVGSWASRSLDGARSSDDVRPDTDHRVKPNAVGGSRDPGDERTDPQTDWQIERQTERQTEQKADKRTERKTERQTERQAERQPERQAERQAEQQSERQAERHAEQQSEWQAERQARQQTEQHAEQQSELQSELQSEWQAERQARRQTEQHAKQQSEQQSEWQARRQTEQHAEQQSEWQAERQTEGQTDRQADGLAGTDEPLFEPVDRQDDLQRLDGIGPLTEKALNDLGITSYPQLAELRQFEIRRIADALQIVPETIERDDWVGNARRQLEEVLEEL